MENKIDLIKKRDDFNNTNKNEFKMLKDNGENINIIFEKLTKIDPLSLDEYISLGGYESLLKAIELNQDSIISEIEKSSLISRSHGNKIIAEKLSICKSIESEQKYVLCCAEGQETDISAYEQIIIRDPFSIIEGMTIAARAINASKGIIYINYKNELAANIMKQAIEMVLNKGFLGNNILNINFNFELDVIVGNKRLYRGIDLDLLNFIENVVENPPPRSIFPEIEGLWCKPTFIEDVETYSNINWIIKNGSSSFFKIGKGKAKGTKVFSLSGIVKKQGLIEVETGKSLKYIIENNGEGLNEENVKVAYFKGISENFLNLKESDVNIDLETLEGLGSSLAFDCIEIMGDNVCMVNIAKSIMGFVEDKSCGKCAPCRIGNKRILESLERISKGNGIINDLNMILDLAPKIIDSAMCGLGKSAAQKVLSIAENFKDEYESHIINKSCEAKICKF